MLRLTRAASLYGFLIPYLSLSRLSHARVIGEQCSIYARLMHLGTALFLTCPPVARTVVLFHVMRQVHLEHATAAAPRPRGGARGVCRRVRVVGVASRDRSL